MRTGDVLPTRDASAGAVEPARAGFFTTMGEDLLVWFLERRLGSLDIKGRLRLELPSGRSVSFGDGAGVEAAIVLGSLAPVWAGLRRGSIGLVEAHLSGQIESPDLRELLRFFLANRGLLDGLGQGIARFAVVDRAWHRSRANTVAGSRRNIAAHYDLGNAFYALWLDPSMTYSSAIYPDAAARIEEAQAHKITRVVDALGLRADAPVEPRVLEIGCGWGGMAEALARAGASVDAITISAEQQAFAAQRIEAAGFGDRARVRFLDYRETEGTYDGIVSIEMIEAVGEENWPVYFRTVRDRLADGGAAVIQAITIEERHLDAYRRDPDFIQRYVFPGGMLPTVEAMRAEAARAGLTFETVERFGPSYARTLSDWRSKFDEAWPQIAALGFDERFRRLWRYYLTYCEVGFEAGDIDVGIYRLRRLA